jgi:hypothetical protein
MVVPEKDNTLNASLSAAPVVTAETPAENTAR